MAAIEKHNIGFHWKSDHIVSLGRIAPPYHTLMLRCVRLFTVEGILVTNNTYQLLMYHDSMMERVEETVVDTEVIAMSRLHFPCAINVKSSMWSETQGI